MGDSNTEPASVTARLQRHVPDDTDAVEPRGEIDADTDHCRTCGTAIGPREFRLSRVLEADHATLETHYCSEECFPATEPRATTNRSNDVRDWSYCR